MDDSKPLRENPVVDCSAICLRLATLRSERDWGGGKEQAASTGDITEALRAARKRLLLKDLAYKAQPLDANLVNAVAIKYIAPDISSVLKVSKEQEANLVLPDCCLLLVAKPNELKAARAALALDGTKPRFVEDYPTWETIREGGPRSVKFVLAMIGDAGPDVALNACRTLVPKFQAGSAMLCGTAGGLRGRIDLGAVLCAREVTDTVPERIEEDGGKPRHRHFTVSDREWRRLSYFLSESKQHWIGFEAALSRLEARDSPKDIAENWNPAVETGILLSRPKLIADGSLSEARATIDERVRGTEMEASGFCSGCQELGIKWWVFKGISDFGDAESKDGRADDLNDRKAWQFPATVASVVFATNFYCSMVDVGQ